MFIRSKTPEAFAGLPLKWYAATDARHAEIQEAEITGEQVSRIPFVYWTHHGWRAAKLRRYNGAVFLGTLKDGESYGVIMDKGE